MFGSSKRVAFKPVPYQRRRQPRRIPRWLLLVLLGASLGVGGYWYAQESLLPPRLSGAESQQLRADVAASKTELLQLRADRLQAIDQLAQAEAREKKAQADLSSTQKMTDRLQKNLAQFVSALPPDPRGGLVGIRSATFSTSARQLSYSVILTQPAKTTDTFRGAIQFVVTGQRGSGPSITITLNPIALELETFQQLAGSVTLPEGLVPREIAVRVLRGAGGELVSTRVFRIS